MAEKKSFPLAVKLGLDFAMALLFTVSLGFRTIGSVAHEWIGISLCVLFILHIIINLRWYGNILRGKYTFRRSVNTVLNLLLPMTMIVLCVTGILNSRHAFGFLQLKGGMGIRQIHTFVAYWGLILIGVHTGLHWETVLGVARKMAGINGERWIRSVSLRVAAFLVAVYGVWASFDRDMGSKLFLGFSFDFWAPSRPHILFYTHNIAIMGLYIFVTHSVMKLLKKKNGLASVQTDKRIRYKKNLLFQPRCCHTLHHERIHREY